MNQNAASSPDPRDRFLSGLGERVRTLRARRGMTRKRLAEVAGVSERHLANLETGQGNASVMLLRQLAQALEASIAELVGEDSPDSADILAIRRLLHGQDSETLARARRALEGMLDGATYDPARTGRVA